MEVFIKIEVIGFTERLYPWKNKGSIQTSKLYDIESKRLVVKIIYVTNK